MATSQKLKFGAYWDAIPPFYSTQGLPPISEDNYEGFMDSSGLFPIEIPKTVLFTFLWQVRSVKIELEFELGEESDGGWVPYIDGITSDQASAFYTLDKFVLTGAGIPALTSRELRLPQGSVQHLASEPYPGSLGGALNTARDEGFSVITNWEASEYANFTAEKQLLISAINEEKDKIKAKLSLMKSYAEQSKYFVLKEEIERQESAFDFGISLIQEKYQGIIDDIEDEYDKSAKDEISSTVFGKQLQRYKQWAISDVKQEAQLQWFDWEGGFDRQVKFKEVGKYRVESPMTLHNPPTIGGLFAGVYQASNQLNAITSTCIAVISTPTFAFPQVSFFYEKTFEYDREVVIEPEEPETVQVESALIVGATVDPFKLFSTKKDRAAALKIPAFGEGLVFSGYYKGQPTETSSGIYSEKISYSDLYNEFTQDALTDLPTFPQESDYPEPEIAEVVLSGNFFGGGDWSAATDQFQPIAEKVRKLKEIGDATENGTIEFRTQDNAVLFDAPLFVKDGVPIKNVRVIYKIDKFYTDAPDEEEPAGETGSA